MASTSRPCTYFANPGKKNTDQVVEAVLRRLEEGDLATVVVASTTGYTAGRFAEALAGRPGVTLIAVGEAPLACEWDAKARYPFMAPEVKADLERRGVIVADRVPYLMHSSVLDSSRWRAPSAEEIVRDTLYAFGQGLKVAVEVVLIAVASGYLAPYQDVIAVGGTTRGADTAIVVRATFPNHVLSEDHARRLVIREIICKPR
ncbi:MAG: pyruvate kinase alpha/beta domain-containing protein [Anaerolineae bacterium]|nr:pyruvate kinase alpha/beta domain-containing protein [Anaerolineae bacterium]